MPKKMSSELTFVNKLNFLMSKSNISSLKLSKELSKSGIEITFDKILKWISGDSFPTDEEFKVLTDYFNVDKKFFIGDENEKRVPNASKSNNSVMRKNFSNNINNLFRSSPKNQKQIAEDLGVLTSSMCHWSNGTSFPTEAVLIRISEYFGVSVAELVEEKIELKGRKAESFNTLAELLGKIPEENKILVYDSIKAFLKTVK